ncbi:hypothetical protein NGR_b09800 (plasmid) [Sinorhizobium fredii NGR234]|uniref:Uncharacterized protein n=1 Tax=Sinorhizobium fredii (strain NBRC 101917 / NGR234) TaxID=394 RepID=C3KQS5_SINFN|nr:hypothetical protein NGR_b09800 [Sinorhizobium fredii NGR234]
MSLSKMIRSLASNARPVVFLTNPVGKGVTSDYMFDAQQLRKTEFYNDYLRKIGLRVVQA